MRIAQLVHSTFGQVVFYLGLSLSLHHLYASTGLGLLIIPAIPDLWHDGKRTQPVRLSARPQRHGRHPRLRDEHLENH